MAFEQKNRESFLNPIHSLKTTFFITDKFKHLHKFIALFMGKIAQM